MFEKELLEKLGRIFKVKRATFDAVSESAEQDTLFVEIESVKSRVKNGKATGRASGNLRLFTSNSKMPFGFFPKSIELNPDDSKAFFFFDTEENSGRFGNLVERSASFVFFFDSQYNPATGTITSINFSEGE